MDLIQVRRSAAWLLGHEDEAIAAEDVVVHELATCLGQQVVVEDLDGVLHLGRLDPVVEPDGTLALVVGMGPRITVREAIELGAYDRPGPMAPWVTTPSLVRTFRQDRAEIRARLAAEDPTDR